MRWGFCVFPSRLFVHILSLGANPSGFGTAFRRFRLFFGRLRGRFRRLRALLPVGAGCAQARVAYWRVCSARQTTARTRRRELRARPQARWRSDRRVLFAVAILLADCGNPAQIAARLSRLQRSSPNGGILFRIARFSCELPIYSRMTACLLGRRGFSFSCGNFSRTAVCLRDWRVHAGLLGVLYRDIGGGCKAANSANGGAVGLTAGSWRDGELGDGLSAGTTAVSTVNLRLARGGGELGFRLGCKSCVRCVKCTVLPSYAAGRDMPFGECAFFICGGTWELKMLPRELTDCP